ncbi:MAG TPA: PilZ domain-containing protein [Terracidiphilus sp.]|nr:PilZ domain-containing protein [Terracidiphilus sp.]
MQGQTVCVYNQTNECFLSLGASRAEHPLAQLKRRLFARGAHHLVDEGCWYANPKGLRTVGVFARRDLIYLDESFRVVDAIEAFPILRTVPRRNGATSLLALPMHAVSSSQTKPGNQLVICAPEEMEGKLRKIRERANPPCPAQTVVDVSILPQHSYAGTRGLERRNTRVAAVAGKHAPGVHVIRDISATGLYLVTKERWPVGSEVKMSLQRTGPASLGASPAITLQLRVTRWGTDGVGLEFAGPAPEHSGLASMYQC